MKKFKKGTSRMIGGVCSGIAEWIGIDPTFVRIAFVVIFFLTRLPVTVAYIIIWIILEFTDDDSSFY